MKVSTYILLFSIVLNLIFSYLSYKFYADRQVVEVALISCQETNRSLGKTVEKQEKELTLQDSITSEYQQKQQEIRKEECHIVEAISKLPSKTHRDETNEEVNIDAKLPDSLAGMLRESYGGLQRSTGSDATKSPNQSL